MLVDGENENFFIDWVHSFSSAFRLWPTDYVGYIWI